MKWYFAIGVLLCISSGLGKGSDAVRPPEPSKDVPKLMRSVPYPNSNIYLGRGLATGIMIGKNWRESDKYGLWQWSGDIAFYYGPHFSGGANGLINAGQPRDSFDIVENKYFLFIKLHQAWLRHALYAGFHLGIDNQISVDHNEKQEDFSPSLRIDAGWGWKFSRMLGLTLGSENRYSFKFEDQGAGIWRGGIGARHAWQSQVKPGLSVDILYFFPHLRESVGAFYMSSQLELGFWHQDDFLNRKDQSLAFMLGSSLGF